MIIEGMDEVGDAETTSVERWPNEPQDDHRTGIFASGRSFPVKRKSVLWPAIGSFGAKSENGTGA